MKNALKKFHFMMLAMERRNQENSHLGQEILECEVSKITLTKYNVPDGQLHLKSKPFLVKNSFWKSGC